MYVEYSDVHEVKQKSSLLFKRKKQQAKIYSIHGVKPKAFRLESRGVEGIETSLIGREAELIKLRSALEAAQEDKELQVVTVVGEAGLGKSRLLFEFHDQIELSEDKFYVFKARALETMRGIPFSMVRDLFSFRFEISENDTESAAREKFVSGMLELVSHSKNQFAENAEMKVEFIGHLIGFDFAGSIHIKDIVDDEKQIQDRALLYAGQFFQCVAETFPAVFYLDDLHWADDQSIDFFDHIAHECAGEPFLIIELTRPILFERRPHRGEGKENRFRLDLQPLTKRESGKLVESILQKAEEIPIQLRELLVSNTEGNPFYVEELIKMLIEQSAIKTGDDHWTVDSERLGKIEVPPTLTGVLQSRLDKLSLWEKRILQKASVIGREFWDTAFAGFGNEVNVPTILESLRRKELLFRKENSTFEGANEFVFKHALLRDVTYETVLLEERRQWHLETAEWLVESKGGRRNEYLAAIAGHFEKAGKKERSALWYGKAGERARHSYALETAEAHFLKVFGIWNDIEGGDDDTLIQPEQIMKWKHHLGRVYYAQARYSEAVEVFSGLREMARELNNQLSEAYANWGLSFSHFESGDTRRSLESAKEIVRLTRDNELSDTEDGAYLLSMGLYRQARAMISLGEFEKAVELVQSIPEAADRQGSKVTAIEANKYHVLAAANMFLGKFKEAQKHELREVEISRQSGDLRTLGNGLNSLGFQSYMQGSGDEALKQYEEALKIAQEIGDRSNAIMVRSNICGARVLLEDYESAETQLRSIMDVIDDNGHFLVPEMYRFLTESLIGQQRFEAALETALRSLALSESRENREMIGEAWRVLGIVSSCLQKPVVVDEESYSAGDCFERGLNVFKDLKMEANYAQTLHNFGVHLSKTGDQTKAVKIAGREKEISERLELNTASKSPYFTAS